MRSELLAEVTAMKQTPKQSVEDYVGVGREFLLRLRDAGVENPASLLIPCFKAVIEPKLKQFVLTLLNQTQFDTDFVALSQEFQRITVGMPGASGDGNVGQAHSAKSGKRKWVEKRKCFVCGETGHIARACPNKKGNDEKPPVVLLHQGESSNSPPVTQFLFDSGATHHIVKMSICCVIFDIVRLA
jgi:hypothetical protein